MLSFIKEKGSDHFLCFKDQDLIESEPDSEEISQYPDQIKVGEAAFDCRYRFEPGKSDDGVTVNVPVGFISQAAAENIDSYLPSLLQEKAIHLLKSLPKTLLKILPSPAHITELLLTGNHT